TVGFFSSLLGTFCLARYSENHMQVTEAIKNQAKKASKRCIESKLFTRFNLKQVFQHFLVVAIIGGCSPVSEAPIRVAEGSTEVMDDSKIATRSEPRFISAMQPPAPVPGNREERCGLRVRVDARYGEIAELDFADPDSFRILNCIDQGQSTFSFHLNFLAAEYMYSRNNFCDAAKFLAKGLRSTDSLNLAPDKVSPRLEAVSLWQYPWYSQRLCEPRARFDRIVNGVTRSCAVDFEVRYLQGVQTELKQLPSHDNQWSTC
ncbi:hypothetical protein, partial [Sphingomonas sp. 37zxx]|uniref:hypothetical protein n=1 Tax=Sphingomonas sp. 37zxx TaxID=1550073 RepID=UPI001E2FB57B